MTPDAPAGEPAKSRRSQWRALLRWAVPIALLAAGNCGLCLWPLATNVRYRVLGLSMQTTVAALGAVLLVIGLGLSGWAGLDAARSKQTIARLQGRTGDLERALDAAVRAAALALEEHLRLVLADLDLGPDSRISLYAEELGVTGEPTGQLRRMGRYAHSPLWRTGGRVLVPSTQGVVARALRDGECRVVLSFETNAQRVAQHAASAGLTDGRVAGLLRMPSTEYCAFALTDPRSGSFGAVVVVESTKPGALRLPKVRAAVVRRAEPLMRTVTATRLAARTETDGGGFDEPR